MRQHPLAASKYVSLTTYRKSGESVSTPVWIVGLPDGRVGFTTGGESFKVKRIRNNSAVTLQSCDMRGKVLTGPVTSGTATIVQGNEHDVVWKLVKKKYGLMALMIGATDAIKSIFKKGPEDVAVLINLDAAHD